MCSGKGICSWNANPKPVCECFDPDDNSLGCFDSKINQPENDCINNGVIETESPTSSPSMYATNVPSSLASSQPSEENTFQPSISSAPSHSVKPSFNPTISDIPTSKGRNDVIPQKIVTISEGSSKRYSSVIVGTSVMISTMQIISY